MDKVFTAEAIIGSDHRLVIDLPEETSDHRVKVTVEIGKPVTEREPPFERPVGLGPGKVVIHSSFFEPLPEDELLPWESQG